ncbi:MAG: hypothetical protein A2499_04895 [Stygiobacter sp. RIFOXYC12_FULL_38_8]|nr:MAG: hypothetical protein A2299_16265 [Stygiobacter sp. RIFOXYB2_FULL_37_11]OGV13462.1 MAG: hypothetical protein A2237_16960 [Stygiobacter sp. RIFOXYA2_FULL_38_8]OGV14753.1 MAG: hypothetical protein A2440_09645 [Stygiobacter sp. RIFOXYC2_FULL_38_25]OGV22289.1 MAG: hypothetical protein A2499_04895 [Stygiobacter sp. RIFOXYC12_FULL_38_8]OGV79246.1 MAG: hypothetical protein A2X65_02015 [Stygiobacter sp. GWF2_38_21]
MYARTSLKNAIQQTILRNQKTVDHIADEIGRSSNSVYKYGIEGEAGSDMPISLLIPIMKAADNYSILKYIAHICGYILIKTPTAKKTKKDEIELVDEYQTATVNSLKILKDFLMKPTLERYTMLNASLLNVMELCSSNQKYANKKLSGQLEMDYADQR